MPISKPYLQMPIVESGETLLPIPQDLFAFETPHPYEVLGAPYEQASPYFLRKSVLAALQAAQNYLQQLQPHWQIMIFDAYRPIAVQAFMVNFTYDQVLKEKGWHAETLSSSQTEAAWQEVYGLWAPPNLDPKSPPPHSTGAAVDITLFDQQTDEPVFMGSEIDELSVRSHPHYFADLAQNPQTPPNEKRLAEQADQNRRMMCDAMSQAGFQRHQNEWWHFCLGDQMWAWLNQLEQPHLIFKARYGRIEPVGS
ncbi:M15 family metallopeptidase [Acaryochloris marina]|uniref:D-alanyl-D-alanine dipeptidase n=1 Tax=Acaryochloris marina (strain MBIC 11017) TaxID=329726 RepID=B0C330_ACAM1|nr:M15 family metallopeptidase [Acaryochloris marina]ABW27377.1 D-alanyl-d-alanine dipeptidase, putative [Acaryochloris marina MBIC11017]BDM82118.1 D-alanyl-D-alanine dipeptidase [Acaryochloris marina MBIC10699]